MTDASGDILSKSTREQDQAADIAFKKHCLELGEAIGKHDVGETTAKVQQLIMRYYSDVQEQARQSFKSAKDVALLGFALFAATILYVIFADAMPHIRVEVIAGTQFFLYRNSAKQFGAFHICLERTHRYLLAYTMAEQIGAKDKDKTLEKIVCIMANAPMITQQDIEGVGSGKLVPHANESTQGEPEVSFSHAVG
jgi:hypothetical protein